MKRTQKDIVSGYLKHLETQSDDDFWAWKEVDNLVRGNATEAMDIAIALVEACESEEQLSCVAAGPIEDILCRDETFYLMLDKECKRSQKFRRTAHLAYMDESDESFKRWKALLLANGLDSQNDI